MVGLRTRKHAHVRPARRVIWCELAFDQANFAGAGTLAGFLLRELDPLAFPKQLEHRAANRAAVKEMLQAGFITNESEALVD